MTPLEMFKKAMAPYMPPPSYLKPYTDNSDLTGGNDNYPPADANLIADRCRVIGLVRDTGGKVDQPTWYHALAVIGACIDGTRLAHEWSKGDPRYTYEECQRKLLQSMAFPGTTCERFHQSQPTICEACEHWGTIKSPMKLGFSRAVVPLAAIMGAEDDEDAPLQLTLPFGFSYKFEHGRYTLFKIELIKGSEKGKETSQPIAFCDTLFYPVKRIHSQDGDVIEFEYRMKDDGKRRFKVQTSICAQGGNAAAAEFGRHSIAARPGQRQKMDAYLLSWIEELKQRCPEVESYNRFGWYGKHFLVGSTLITPAGTQSVICHGNADQKAAAFDPKGDYATWKQVIADAYHHPGQEPLQYLVLVGFAAPLFSMLKEQGGVTVYCHSEGTGAGKTTAQHAAFSVFGSWPELQLAAGKATINALWQLVGTYCNLPVMFDELTNQSSTESSEFVFSVASGRGKVRLGPDGELLKNTSNWSTILMASGNNLITEKLALARNNPEAEISRTFEFTVPKNSPLTPNQAQELFPLLIDNYGHAGIEFMTYVVKNYDKVEEFLGKVKMEFNTQVNITQGERYWSSLQACVITALHICRTLGILPFSKKLMVDWIREQLALSRGELKDTVGDSLETLGRMLGDLWQGILVTRGEGDLRRNLAAEILQNPRNGSLSGRAILAIDKTEKDVLLLSCSAVRAWCNEKGASAKDLHASMVDRGWADKSFEKVSLGKGVPQYVTTNVKCWVIDLQKVYAETRDQMVAQRLQLVMTPGVTNGNTAPPATAQAIGLADVGA